MATAPGVEAQSTTGQSELVVWNCVGGNCPWGTWLDGQALVWPAAQNPLNARFGYQTSRGIYLPASVANRVTVWVDVGSATLYAGYPDGASHRALATVSGSNYFDVTGLAEGEVLSVQGGGSFQYEIELRDPPPAGGPAQPEVPSAGASSQFVTWNCTGTNCPWGGGASGHALVWPDAADATAARLGYTVSKNVYLGYERANGTAIQLDQGFVTVFAGAPNAASHRLLATISAGSTYEVAGVSVGEVVSVQSDSSFSYSVVVAPPVTTQPPVDPGPSDPPPNNPPAPQGPTSAMITWTCTASPCPWGTTLFGDAQVWDTADALATRLGYTTSGNIYLPAFRANGTSLLLSDGSASLYAGLPGSASHRLIGTLVSGQAYQVAGLVSGEVLSLQGSGPFRVAVELGTGTNPGPGEDPGTPPVTGPGPGTPPPANLVQSVRALWRCNIAECSGDDWAGAVINWPSWAAYSNNNREYSSSRTVYSESGALLYPYMGSWANGCQVSVYSGTAMIIEWQRGTNEWREIVLHAGQSHTISLTAPEDGAMIEANGFDDFAVTLNNCTPQALP